MIGFRKTFFLTNALNSADCSFLDCLSLGSPPLSSGNPTEEGVSLTSMNTRTATITTTTAGMRKAQRQCWEKMEEASKYFPQSTVTIYPQKMMARPAPIEWEVFHSDIFVASFSGFTQCVIKRVQGGTPIPWNQPLRTQNIPSTRIEEERPNSTLASAHSMSPQRNLQDK